jgi:hypothetical protein
MFGTATQGYGIGAQQGIPGFGYGGNVQETLSQIPGLGNIPFTGQQFQQPFGGISPFGGIGQQLGQQHPLLQALIAQSAMGQQVQHPLLQALIAQSALGQQIGQQQPLLQALAGQAGIGQQFGQQPLLQSLIGQTGFGQTGFGQAGFGQTGFGQAGIGQQLGQYPWLQSIVGAQSPVKVLPVVTPQGWVGVMLVVRVQPIPVGFGAGIGGGIGQQVGLGGIGQQLGLGGIGQQLGLGGIGGRIGGMLGQQTQQQLPLGFTGAGTFAGQPLGYTPIH